MAEHKNTTGSLNFNGQGGTGYSRGTRQYDHNYSGLTPVTTGSRTNLKGNGGGLASLSGTESVIGAATKPMNWKSAGVKDTHVDSMVRGSRTNMKGNM
jgi:hypothetical protein